MSITKKHMKTISREFIAMRIFKAFKKQTSSMKETKDSDLEEKPENTCCFSWLSCIFQKLPNVFRKRKRRQHLPVSLPHRQTSANSIHLGAIEKESEAESNMDAKTSVIHENTRVSSAEPEIKPLVEEEREPCTTTPPFTGFTSPIIVGVVWKKQFLCSGEQSESRNKELQTIEPLKKTNCKEETNEEKLEKNTAMHSLNLHQLESEYTTAPQNQFNQTTNVEDEHSEHKTATRDENTRKSKRNHHRRKRRNKKYKKSANHPNDQEISYIKKSEDAEIPPVIEEVNAQEPQVTAAELDFHLSVNSSEHEERKEQDVSSSVNYSEHEQRKERDVRSLSVNPSENKERKEQDVSSSFNPSEHEEHKEQDVSSSFNPSEHEEHKEQDVSSLSVNHSEHEERKEDDVRSSVNHSEHEEHKEQDVSSLSVNSTAHEEREEQDIRNNNPKHQQTEWSTSLFSPLPLPHLRSADRSDILEGRWLSDDVIDLAQEVLQRRFPETRGLYACGAAFTLPPLQPGATCTFLQVVNRSAPMSLDCMADYGRLAGTHWLLLSSYGAQRPGQLAVYDSMYNSLSSCTTALVEQLQDLHVPPPGAIMRPVQQQNDGYSCGLFALAFAFSIALGQDPCTVRYDRASMAPHLVRCLEQGVVEPFPSTPVGRKGEIRRKTPLSSKRSRRLF